MWFGDKFLVGAGSVEEFVGDAFPAAGELVAVVWPDVFRHVLLLL